MATLPVYNLKHEEVGAIEVSDDVFAAEVNRDLFYEVVKWQLAKKRQGTACTKGRSDVAGGGRKPYRQKGTGRARQGSRTAPQHRGGGAVHGPTPRSYEHRINKKVRRAALQSALSLRAEEGRVYVLDSFQLDEVKTVKAARIFERIAGGDALVIDDHNDKLRLSVRNLPKVTYLAAEGLNVFDILKHRYLVLSEPMVRRIEGRLRVSES